MNFRLFPFVIIWVFSVFAQKDSLPVVAVIDFAARGVSHEDAVTMSERFAAELMQNSRFQVQERARINEVLKEVAFQQAVCSDPGCAVDIGKLIAARKVVLGTIARVGDIYTVNIKLVDVETGKVETSLSEDCDCAIEEVLTGTLKHLAGKLGDNSQSGVGAVFSLQKGDASVFVKSVPESAMVIVDGIIINGSTPVTIQGLAPGRHVIRVQKGDSAATAVVSSESRRIARISLILKSQQTALKVISEPSEAEVYLDARPGRSRWPDQITPAIFENNLRDNIKVTLFKPGYFDTAFSVHLIKNRENTVNISMNVADPGYSKFQNKFVHQRRQRRTGLYISSTSGLFLAGGITSFILAKRDYTDALKAKKLLDGSIIKSGPAYDAALDENRKKSTSGDSKKLIGVLLSGTAAIGLGAGITLYF